MPQVRDELAKLAAGRDGDAPTVLTGAAPPELGAPGPPAHRPASRPSPPAVRRREPVRHPPPRRPAAPVPRARPPPAPAPRSRLAAEPVGRRTRPADGRPPAPRWRRSPWPRAAWSRSGCCSPCCCPGSGGAADPSATVPSTADVDTSASDDVDPRPTASAPDGHRDRRSRQTAQRPRRRRRPLRHRRSRDPAAATDVRRGRHRLLRDAARNPEAGLRADRADPAGAESREQLHRLLAPVQRRHARHRVDDRRLARGHASVTFVENGDVLDRAAHVHAGPGLGRPAARSTPTGPADACRRRTAASVHGH